MLRLPGQMRWLLRGGSFMYSGPWRLSTESVRLHTIYLLPWTDMFSWYNTRGPAGRGRLFLARGEGVVVLDAAVHREDPLDEIVQVGGLVDEVDLARVDHEQRRLLVVK